MYIPYYVSAMARSKHWEALEWLLFLTTHPEATYWLTHGEKDTLRPAFHLAGRADSFQQVWSGLVLLCGLASYCSLCRSGCMAFISCQALP